MKQRNVKKNNTSKRTSGREKQPINDLNDIGLEPPKIYRKSQNAIVETQNKMSETAQRMAQRTHERNNPTRNERRAKESKKRKHKNKLRKAVIWFIVALMFIGIAVVLSLTVFFNIDKIEIKGSKIYSNEEITAVCPIDIGENLFMSNTDKAAQKLEENLPYIYNAEIKRKLPGTVQINITDAKVAYSIKQKDKKYTYLDDNFKVLQVGNKKSKGIKITQADIKKSNEGSIIEFKNTDVGDCLIKLAACIKDNHIEDITQIYCKNISDNYIVYDGRIVFKLGTCDKLEKKVFQCLATCEQLNESSPNVKGTITATGDKQIYFTEN